MALTIKSVHCINYPVKTWDHFGTQRGPLSKVEPGEAASFTEFPTSVCCRYSPVEECFSMLARVQQVRQREAHTQSPLQAAGQGAVASTWTHTRQDAGYQWLQHGKGRSAAPCHQHLQNWNPTRKKRGGNKSLSWRRKSWPKFLWIGWDYFSLPGSMRTGDWNQVEV